MLDGKMENRDKIIKALQSIAHVDTDIRDDGSIHRSTIYDAEPDAALRAIRGAVDFIQYQHGKIRLMQNELNDIRLSQREDKEPDDTELKQLEQDDLIRRMNNEIQYMRGKIDVYERLFAPDDTSCDKCEMHF